MAFQRLRSKSLNPLQGVTELDPRLLLAAIVDSSQDAIVSQDMDGRVTSWNPAAERTFGYSREEMIGQSLLPIIPSDLQADALELDDRVRAGEMIDGFETIRLHRDGRPLQVAVTISPIQDDNGEVKGISKIIREIAERKAADELRYRLAAIVESSDDAIVGKDLNGIINSWNKGAEKLFGYRAEEMIGQSVLKLIPPQLQHEEPVILARIAANQRIDHHETQRLTKDGRIINVSLTISPVRGADGKLIGASKIARDISERRTVDDLRSRMAAIVESSDDAIISKDLTGIITSWNAAAEKLFGYTADEIIGKSVLTLIPQHLQHEEPEILARLRANQKIDHYETQRITKTGEIIEVSLTISPIRDARGTVVGASKIARDISERKKAQKALIESEKLAATARMAATIAHEINNPLESVTNLAYLLATDNTLSETAHKYAEMLLAEVSRASDIARQTLSFYRDNSTPGEVHMAGLIRSMIEIHGPRFQKRNVGLVLSLDERGTVWGLSSEVRQVLVNLLLNAADAVGENGEVQIRLRIAGNKVKVLVSDNGSGIPKQYRKRVFEPFFTTKSSKGNGLGLWVSKGIVEKHQGSIRLRSRTEGPYHGTVFQVTLPLHKQSQTRGNVA